VEFHSVSFLIPFLNQRFYSVPFHRFCMHGCNNTLLSDCRPQANETAGRCYYCTTPFVRVGRSATGIEVRSHPAHCTVRDERRPTKLHNPRISIFFYTHCCESGVKTSTPDSSSNYTYAHTCQSTFSMFYQSYLLELPFSPPQELSHFPLLDHHPVITKKWRSPDRRKASAVILSSPDKPDANRVTHIY
jgi:hypothetical protein